MKFFWCIVIGCLINVSAVAQVGFPVDIRIGLARIVLVGEVTEKEELKDERFRYHLKVHQFLKYRGIYGDEEPPEKLHFLLPSSTTKKPIGPTGELAVGDKKVFLMNLSLGKRDYVLFKEVFPLERKEEIHEIISNPQRPTFHSLTYLTLSEATVRILPEQMTGDRVPTWEELLTDALSTTDSGMAEVVLRKIRLSLPEGEEIDWSDVEVGERISLYSLLQNLADSNGLVLEIGNSKVSLSKPRNQTKPGNN